MKSKLHLITLYLLTNFQILEAQSPNWLWAKTGDGGLKQFAQDVATDKSGNVYLAGQFSSPTMIFDSDTLFKNSNPENFYLAKFNTNGNIIWAKSMGTLNGEIRSVAIDPSGNVIVTGLFENRIIIDNDTFNICASCFRNFMVKYDSAGNVLWKKILQNSYYNTPAAIDASANIFVAYDSTFLDKYDSNGNIIWSKNVISSNTYEVTGIACDPAGSVYVNGTFEDTLIFDNDSLFNGGIYLVKYDSNGNMLWAKSNPGVNNMAWANTITCDASANVFITGQFSGSISFDNVTLNNGYTYLAKYDSSGHALWARGGQSRFPYAVKADSLGNVYVAQNFETDSVVFDGHVLNNPNSTSIMFVVKYDPAGNIVWTKQTTGVASSIGYNLLYSINIDPMNNIYITGLFETDTVYFDANMLVNPYSLCWGGYCWKLFLAKLDNASFTTVDEIRNSNLHLIVFPNPVSNSTTTVFTLPSSGNTSIKIYDIAGRLVTTLAEGIFPAGVNKVVWNIKDTNAGMYFLNFKYENHSETKIISVIK